MCIFLISKNPPGLSTPKIFKSGLHFLFQLILCWEYCNPLSFISFFNKRNCSWYSWYCNYSDVSNFQGLGTFADLFAFPFPAIRIQRHEKSCCEKCINNARVIFKWVVRKGTNYCFLIQLWKLKLKKV